MNSKSWLKTAIADVDWINGGEEYWEEDYPAFKVERAASFNTNLLCFAVQLGGYAIYPTDLAPIAPRLEYDLLARLIEEAHGRGLKLMVYWLATTPSAALQAREHPDWQQRNFEGEPTGCMCYISPFGRFTLSQVAEVLQRYEVDGIYFDQMPVSCYCPYCREKYQQRFGLDMLEARVQAKSQPGISPFAVEAERGGHSIAVATAQELQFTQENTYWWIRSVRSLVDEHRPACAYAQGKLWGPALTKYSREVDFILPEVLWWTAGWDLDRLALHRQVSVMASGGKMCMDAAKYDNTNVERRPLAEVKLEVANGLTVDCNPLLREARSADLSPVDKEDLAAFLGQAGQILKLRENARRVSQTALVHCPAVDRSAVNDMGPNLSDAYQLLRQHQIAVDLVDEVGSAAETFQPYDLVVVPEYASMAPEAEAALAQYIHAGGAVVASVGSTEGIDLEGFDRRPLAKMLGISVLGLSGYSSIELSPSLSDVAAIPAHTRRPFNYGEIVAFDPICNGFEGSVINFEQPYLEATFGPDCKELLFARTFDMDKVSRQPFNRRMFWPGGRVSTLAATFEGKGRVVFFATPVFLNDVRRWAVDLDTLIIRAMRWAQRAGDEVRTVEAPQALRMASYRDEGEKQYLIVLSHHATNDLRRRAIRHVDPSGPITIGLNPRFPLTEAHSLFGGRCEIVENDGELLLRVESVRFLEAVIVR